MPAIEGKARFAMLGLALAFAVGPACSPRPDGETVTAQREPEPAIEPAKDPAGTLVSGVVRRVERGDVIVGLGDREGVIPARERVRVEAFRPGDPLFAYVIGVHESDAGRQLALSRSHPDLVVKLFEREVPEIAEGIVVIEGVARAAGSRAKIAVRSLARDVDPVGACVGIRGSRVGAVVQELRGEKIDIVPWDRDAARFVTAALAPAAPTHIVVDETEQEMEIVVPDAHLPLAVGDRGENLRLAAQLSGWKLVVLSETKAREEGEGLAHRRGKRAWCERLMYRSS